MLEFFSVLSKLAGTGSGVVKAFARAGTGLGVANAFSPTTKTIAGTTLSDPAASEAAKALAAAILGTLSKGGK